MAVETTRALRSVPRACRVARALTDACGDYWRCEARGWRLVLRVMSVCADPEVARMEPGPSQHITAHPPLLDMTSHALRTAGEGLRQTGTDHSRRHTASILTVENTSFVRFKGFTAVTMKNVVFWDIKTKFVPRRRHITSPL
jgi:hypothetical protein